jgi:hypothetical protein
LGVVDLVRSGVLTGSGPSGAAEFMRIICDVVLLLLSVLALSISSFLLFVLV